MGVKVLAVRRVGRAPVYNMEVEDVHDFVLAGGVVAHNCYDDARYLCQMFPVAPRRPEKLKYKPYNPLMSDEGDVAAGYGFIRM